MHPPRWGFFLASPRHTHVVVEHTHLVVGREHAHVERHCARHRRHRAAEQASHAVGLHDAHKRVTDALVVAALGGRQRGIGLCARSAVWEV
eukprot:366045-Chlamydomonas_euryale.AAC.21